MTQNLPPEYAGTAVSSTRTARDIFNTTEEINAYIKRKIEEELKKKEEDKKKGILKRLRALIMWIILSPVIVGLEYLIIMRIMKTFGQIN